jgi:galactitol-specific phosphotransferase system IIB component
MKYYIPFKAVGKNIPYIRPNKNYRRINQQDIGKLNTTVYLENSFKDKQFDRIPPSIMTLNTALVINEKVKNFIHEKKYNINIEQACYINYNNDYFDDYWLITPKVEESIIDLDKSTYKKEVILESMPELDMYEFEKIVVNKEKIINEGLFWEKYFCNLVLTEDFFQFICKNKVILPFLAGAKSRS